MKKLKFVLLASLLLVMLACERENKVSEVDLETSLELSTDLTNEVELPLNQQQRSSSADEIEINSAWTGFILAKMLRYNEASSRNLVSSELGLLGTTFPISNILGPTGDVSFTHTFRSHLAYYIEHSWPDPDGEKDKPGFPLGENPPNPSNNQTGSDGIWRGLDTSGPNSQAVQEVMDILLDENCLEFHFPNGLNFNGAFSTTSVAHPMNLDAMNQGIKRTYFSQTVSNGTIGSNSYQNYTNIVDVDIAYVNAGGNIIIVRPYKLTVETCNYSEYGDIDFYDFLR